MNDIEIFLGESRKCIISEDRFVLSFPCTSRAKLATARPLVLHLVYNFVLIVYIKYIKLVLFSLHTCSDYQCCMS